MSETHNQEHIQMNECDVIDHSSNHAPKLMTSLLDLYEKQMFMDCHLVVEDQKIACHRVALSVNSPVLHNMLTAGMIETHNSTIPVSHFSYNTMKNIVK